MFNHRVLFVVVIILLAAMLLIPTLYALFSDDCADSPDTVSPCEYRKVKDGMTVIEVEAIAGFYGTRIHSSPDSNTYIWENPDGSSMTCVFKNNELTNKSWKGLD